MSAPPRIALSIGPRLRGWEAQAIAALRAEPGLALLGWMEAVGQGARRLLPTALARKADAHPALGAGDAAALNGLRRLSRQEAAEAGIILHLGGSAPDAPITPDGNRHWCFRHGDGTPGSACPPGMRESILGLPHARFALIDCAEGGVLHECVIPLEGAPFADAATIAALAALWPVQQLRAIIAHGHRPPEAPSKPGPALPPVNWWRLLRWRWRRMAGAPALAPLDESGPWNIGVLHQPAWVLLQEDGSRNVRWLPSPSKGRSRMEPFGYFAADGELNALYRKGDEDGGGGVIARVRPKADNILKRSRTMLDSVPGAGYPYVVRIGDAVHAAITDLERGEVRLRPVASDNSALEEGRAILAEPLLAPTLFEHGGRWWLFGTKQPYPEALLHAYHAASPWGPFTPHASAPLKCHVAHSRPAGTPFTHQGQLYRPALDATDPLHPAVWIMRIDHLSPEGFVEHPVRRLAGFSSTAYGMGVRTVSAIGDVTLVDGLRSPVLQASKANARRGQSGRRSHQHDEE